MKKTTNALMILGLITATFFFGSTMATMQERRDTSTQTNQNNSARNGNSNRSQNGNMTNSNMNRNGSGSMMNSNTNRNGSGNMMNSGGGTPTMVSTGAMAGSAAMIGNMSVEEFNSINAQGNAAVAAIQPTSSPLSKNDQKLMMEVAMGGMRQLEVSRVALQKATGEEARLLAQSEVEEQTGVSAKLREIATAKGITLPMAPDSKTQSMVAKMQAMSAGAEFDRMYVRESGVKGHEKLQSVMNKVQSKGADPALTGLAMATTPVIRTHLQVSRSVVDNLSGRGRMANNGR